MSEFETYSDEALLNFFSFGDRRLRDAMVEIATRLKKRAERIDRLTETVAIERAAQDAARPKIGDRVCTKDNHGPPCTVERISSGLMATCGYWHGMAHVQFETHLDALRKLSDPLEATQAPPGTEPPCAQAPTKRGDMGEIVARQGREIEKIIAFLAHHTYGDTWQRFTESWNQTKKG